MDTQTSSSECAANTHMSLRETIVQGGYRPGQRLLALDIAKKLGVSRTPVREALVRLCDEGLVEQDQAGGFFVRTMTLVDVEELFTVREMLEQEAAQLALRRVDPAWLAQLDGLLAASETAFHAGQAVAAIAAARKFHLAIAARTGNRLLCSMVESISDRVHMLGVALLADQPQRAQQVLAENRAILAALAIGEAETVRKAVHNHIERSRLLIFPNQRSSYAFSTS
ncbi:MAG TPA: GntR family transcriptional regulator [Pseudorhodoferax sp.]|jgi:DNA-binding GntR family transcriptional regulator|nr:GntR family transcriptional regulator [Pseudorhodoferax sp.]